MNPSKKNERAIRVPKEILPYIEIVASCIKEAAAENKIDDISVVVSKPRQANWQGAEMIAPVLLILSGSVSSWLTKKWIDTYVWPKIQTLIDKPSRELVDWLFGGDRE